MSIDLARKLLDRVFQLDPPIGHLMEVVSSSEEGPLKTELKEICGDLLARQFDLIEELTEAYPELGAEIDRRVSRD